MSHMDEEPVEDLDDPFSEKNLAISTWITTARIYDVLLALLTKQDPDMARDLMEVHSGGALMGTQPSFNGVFVTDEVNDPSQSDEVNAKADDGTDEAEDSTSTD